MERTPIHHDSANQFEKLPANYWYEVAANLYKESGEIPDPLQIRAAAIIDALGLPLGESSALSFHEGKERTDEEVKKDKIIAELLTNKPGVVVDTRTGIGDIVSTDFRDIYPDGLPEELKNALDPETKKIMEIEYEHAEAIREQFGNTSDPNEADRPVHYFRLPGGVDFFLRAYQHEKAWHKNHKNFFQGINKNAKIICIEGFPNLPFGDSMKESWSSKHNYGYDSLMREAAEASFNGLFTEIDARDESKVRMDTTPSGHFPDLPHTFFQKYLEFLEREHPHLTKVIFYTERLKALLEDQSSSSSGSDSLRGVVAQTEQQGKRYSGFPYSGSNNEISLTPTFLELGQQLFSDALAAVKLHLIAKLMSDGHLPKGPIVDYEGGAHLSSKSFFLRNPAYAMEVVLRTVNELMAGRAKEKNWFLKLFREGDMKEIYKVFDDPDWTEIVKEIVRLPFKQVENAPAKTIAPGPNQRKLIDCPVDVLALYHINPETVVPPDEAIKRIREKLTTFS